MITKYLSFATTSVIAKTALLFLTLFFFSCANIVTPSGGLRDNVPPKLVESVPSNYSTNFNEKKVVLSFDEFVVLNDLNNQLQTFPLMSATPDVNLRGKSIIVKILDSLKPSTTYNISFGEAIADLHENNKLKGFDFVFSTGSYVDTAAIVGRVFDAQSAKAEKSIFVMLYNKLFDSIPYLEKPDYITKTDDIGFFSFKNLPNSKTFKLFALKDANGNMIYDLPNEKIAFVNQNVNSYFDNNIFKDSSRININFDYLGDTAISNKLLSNLYMFQEEDTIQKLLKAQLISHKTILLSFRNPLNKEFFKLKPIDGIKLPIMQYEFAKTLDSITVWVSDTLIDTAKFAIFDGHICLDTVITGLKYKAKQRSSNSADRTYTQISTNIYNQTIDNRKTLILVLNNPIAKIDTNKILIKCGKDTIRFTIEGIDSLSRTFAINSALQKDSVYQVLIEPKAFLDIFKFYNDTTKLLFRLNKESDFCGISIKFAESKVQKNYLVQLISSSDKILEQKVINNTSIEFSRLYSGNYKLKIVLDSNQNAKWDSGRYSTKQQPEKTWVYPKDIQLKPGFTSEIEWIF